MIVLQVDKWIYKYFSKNISNIKLSELIYLILYIMIQKCIVKEIIKRQNMKFMKRKQYIFMICSINIQNIVI